MPYMVGRRSPSLTDSLSYGRPYLDDSDITPFRPPIPLGPAGPNGPDTLLDLLMPRLLQAGFAEEIEKKMRAQKPTAKSKPKSKPTPSSPPGFSGFKGMMNKRRKALDDAAGY